MSRWCLAVGQPEAAVQALELGRGMVLHAAAHYGVQALGVTLNQVVRSLEEGNENVAAGLINERGSEWLVTGVGRVRTLDDIGATVVSATNGVGVTVAQLGEVRIGTAPNENR